MNRGVVGKGRVFEPISCCDSRCDLLPSCNRHGHALTRVNHLQPPGPSLKLSNRETVHNSKVELRIPVIACRRRFRGRLITRCHRAARTTRILQIGSIYEPIPLGVLPQRLDSTSAPSPAVSVPRILSYRFLVQKVMARDAHGSGGVPVVNEMSHFSLYMNPVMPYLPFYITLSVVILQSIPCRCCCCC